MKLSENEILRNSFVITTSDEKLNRFHSVFRDCGFEIMPKPHFGRYVDRKSAEYSFNRHYIAAHGSHFEVCENAAEENLPFVCVFEDDATPCVGIHEKLAEVLSNVPDDAYILKMGYVPFSGFKYRESKLKTIECVTDSKYSETYLGGSHSYIIFRSFYEHSHDMFERYKELAKEKDTRSIHNPMFFDSETLKRIWLYEWLMTPNVYKNEELQKRIYSVNPNLNLFVQPAFVTWNEETRKVFNNGN